LTRGFRDILRTIIAYLDTQVVIRLCQGEVERLTRAAIAAIRVIVAHAQSNGYAPLITSDAKIRKHYAKAVW
jgi:hypothetical protein